MNKVHKTKITKLSYKLTFFTIFAFQEKSIYFVDVKTKALKRVYHDVNSTYIAAGIIPHFLKLLLSELANCNIDIRDSNARVVISLRMF